MNNYFDINYKAFTDKKDYNSYIMDEECTECSIVLDEDLNGNEIFGIKKDDRIWYLGSRYDNNYFIDTWIGDIEVESFKAVICVFGLGDYRLLDRLSQKYTDVEIVVYEPNLTYLRNIMEAYDLTEIINRKNVEIVAGKRGIRLLADIMSAKVDITNYKTSIFKINTQYSILYGDELAIWNGVIQDNVNTLLIDKNTYRKFGEERLLNNVANFYDCIKSKNVKELLDAVSAKRCDTAILVAAGPSLDKNVNLLKEVKNKAFIMAVDTAIKPVLNAGVEPDLTVTIDSHKPKELFMYKGEYVDIPIIVDLQSNSEVISEYKGRRFYTYNFSKSFFRVYMQPDFMLVNLDSGGSVANDAFSFLLKCGFKNIVFIGQDLAYSNHKTHAGSAYDDEQVVKFQKSEKHFLIEDIYGEQVYTEGNMDAYRKWFERYIEANKDVRFIDATEGGAKIKGTDIMTLREVIDELIVNLPETDYSSVIKELPEIADDVLQARLERFSSIPEELEKTRQDINKALQLYDEMDELNRKNKQNSERFITVSKKISDITNAIEDSIYAAFVSNIIDDTEYDILEEIYEDKTSVYEEVKLVVESGRKMLNKYKDKFEYIRELIVKMVEDIDS